YFLNMSYCYFILNIFSISFLSTNSRHFFDNGTNTVHTYLRNFFGSDQQVWIVYIFCFKQNLLHVGLNIYFYFTSPYFNNLANWFFSCFFNNRVSYHFSVVSPSCCSNGFNSIYALLNNSFFSFR